MDHVVSSARLSAFMPMHYQGNQGMVYRVQGRQHLSGDNIDEEFTDWGVSRRGWQRRGVSGGATEGLCCS
jgi:hypothetical protein